MVLRQRRRDEDSDWAAIPALQAFQKLPDEVKELIEEQLTKEMKHILGDDSIPRRIQHLSVQITTNKGETIDFGFNSTREAIASLTALDLQVLFEKDITPFQTPAPRKAPTTSSE